MKRIIVIGDLHCGHRVGITPPHYQWHEAEDSSVKRNKWARIQKEMWKQFTASLMKHGPYDYVFSMGDNLEGKGSKSGGTELITSNLAEQADIAVAVHTEVEKHCNKGLQKIGIYGTPYHVAPTGELWDSIVYERSNFDKHGWNEWPQIYDTVFDLKHFISGSQIPHGRGTALLREFLWNVIWAERGEKPKANFFIRAHVHYHAFVGNTERIGLINPALQGMGSNYGAERFSGTVDWGFTVIDVEKNNRVSWRAITHKLPTQNAQVMKLG